MLTIATIVMPPRRAIAEFSLQVVLEINDILGNRILLFIPLTVQVFLPTLRQDLHFEKQIDIVLSRWSGFTSANTETFEVENNPV